LRESPPHHDDEGGLFVILVYVYVNRCGGSGVSLELGGIFYEKRKGA